MEKLSDEIKRSEKKKSFMFNSVSFYKRCLITLSLIFLMNQLLGEDLNINSGLRLHCTFEEDFGNIIWDSSGNGNIGTINGNGKRANGRFGQALLLDGQAAYVQFPSSASLKIKDKATFSVWIKPFANKTATIMQSSSHLNRLLLMSEAWIQASFGLEEDRFAVDNKNIDYINKWLHLAACFDGTKIILYVNGEKTQELLIPENNPNKLILKGPYTIGSEDGNAHFYNGLIDEVRIYNRSLRQDEISVLASQKPTVEQEQYSYEAKCNILQENAGNLQKKLSDLSPKLLSKQIAALEKLYKEILSAKENADPGMGNWALDVYPAFLDNWNSINNEIAQINSDCEKENLLKRSSISEKLGMLKSKIDVLQGKKINARALKALVEKAEIYGDLNSLESATVFQRNDFLEKSMNFIEEGEKLYANCNEPESALTQKEGEFYPGVTWSVNNPPELFPALKLLRISFIGNNGIRLSVRNNDPLSWDFNQTDDFFAKTTGYGLDSMIYVPEIVLTMSKFYEDRGGFENELVEGNSKGAWGKWLIPAAPQDIPLKWVSEQYKCFDDFAARYGKNAYLHHWDIVGEAKPLSTFYAKSILVQNAFRKYLSEKYGSIGELNRMWQVKYADFESIPVQENPSNKWARLEWHIFTNKIYCNYLAYLTEPFKKNCPSIPVSPVVCMNIMFPSEGNLDPYMLAEAGGIYLDAALDDYASRRDRYPHQVLAAVTDTGRSISEKRRVWIGELGYSISEKTPHSDCVRPHEVREWYYTAFIHGAKGVAAFWWSAGNGSFALLDSERIPTESALKISELAAEVRMFKNIWECTPEVEVALYYPRLSRFLYPESQIAQRLEMMGLWAIMSNCGFMIDPIDSSILMKRLDKYKVLVIPPASYLSLEEQNRISGFIQNGGIVMTSDVTGEFDEKARKSQTPFRTLIENSQKEERNVSKYFKTPVSHGKGFMLVFPKDIGRTYRDDWNSTELINDPVPPTFNREVSIKIRNELLAILKDKKIIPYSCSDTDEVETAIINSASEKYLVVINHNSKLVKANISLGANVISNKEIMEVFSLRKYEVKSDSLSLELTPNEVLFLKL